MPTMVVRAASLSLERRADEDKDAGVHLRGCSRGRSQDVYLGFFEPKKEDGSESRSRLNACSPSDVPHVQPHKLDLDKVTDEQGCSKLPRRVQAPGRQVQLSIVGDMLGLLMAPGDVLITKATSVADRGLGCLAGLGAAGGFMGHALLVVSPPASVWQQAPEVLAVRDAWPSMLDESETSEIWRVRTLESTRSERGLHTADALLCVTRSTGQLVLLGEIDQDGGALSLMESPVPVELWQSPGELRGSLRLDFVDEVLIEMKAGEADWSAVTAARALLASAGVAGRGVAQTLEEVQAGWREDPICTSVVIAFWQRYLCKFAKVAHNQTAIDLIRRWMPLRCDRVLPGDLVSSLQSTGWILILQIPRIFWPILLPPTPCRASQGAAHRSCEPITDCSKMPPSPATPPCKERCRDEAAPTARSWPLPEDALGASELSSPPRGWTSPSPRGFASTPSLEGSPSVFSDSDVPSRCSTECPSQFEPPGVKLASLRRPLNIVAL